jgi:hypothetical protein
MKKLLLSFISLYGPFLILFVALYLAEMGEILNISTFHNIYVICINNILSQIYIFCLIVTNLEKGSYQTSTATTNATSNITVNSHAGWSYWGLLLLLLVIMNSEIEVPNLQQKSVVFSISSDLYNLFQSRYFIIYNSMQYILVIHTMYYKFLYSNNKRTQKK